MQKALKRDDERLTKRNYAKHHMQMVKFNAPVPMPSAPSTVNILAQRAGELMQSRSFEKLARSSELSSLCGSLQRKSC